MEMLRKRLALFSEWIIHLHHLFTLWFKRKCSLEVHPQWADQWRLLIGTSLSLVAPGVRPVWHPSVFGLVCIDTFYEVLYHAWHGLYSIKAGQSSSSLSVQWIGLLVRSEVNLQYIPEVLAIVSKPVDIVGCPLTRCSTLITHLLHTRLSFM